MWNLGAKIFDRSDSTPEPDDKHVRPGDGEDTMSAQGWHQTQHEKDIRSGNGEATTAQRNSMSSTFDNESLSSEAQLGVKKVQAATSVWTTRDLIIAYIIIYLIYVLDSLQQQITASFTPFVTSSFNLHSLTAATNIMSQIISGLARLPLAKILDVWGRWQGFTIMVCLLILGLVMMAACNNVETYAAAQVFYWTGYTGITYVLAVVIADTTRLKNRGFMYAFASSPFIFTAWAGGPAAESFLETSGWRWGFGAFAIITPVVCFPLSIVLWYNTRKALRQGVLQKREDSGRNVLQSISYYFVELDILGLIMIVGGLALFLLPFSLYSYQADRWRSPIVLGMLIGGIVLLILFGCYEKFLAPKSFLPMDLLFDRTVWASSAYGAVAFVAFYIWSNFFTSFLIVVNDLSVTNASYIRNIYSVGSCAWAFLVGWLIRYTGRFKWLALYFGAPVSILGVALMVHFRQPNVSIGYIVMCQIFIAVGGGTTVICQQLAAMAATSHQRIAVVLAIQYAFTSVGGAIGSTIASAIWTGVFPDRLALYLPEESQADYFNIYSDLTVQTSYPVGSPTRNAINAAYGDAQRYMLASGAAFLGFGWILVAFWKDIGIKNIKQTKGRVI